MIDRMEIRRCRREDLRALEWDGLFTHHREIIERTFAEQTNGMQVMLVGALDGQPVAQAWIALGARTRRKRRAGTLWAVRVHPRLRGRGLGQRLVTSAERTALEHGLDQLDLVVEHTNAAGRAFWERLGYEPIGPVSQHYSYTTPDGRAVTHHLQLVEMRKDLALCLSSR